MVALVLQKKEDEERKEEKKKHKTAIWLPICDRILCQERERGSPCS